MVVRLQLITAPAVEPVTVEDIRIHARIDAAIEDDYIERLIAAARRVVEDYGHRCLITQTWDEFFDAWPDENELRLMKRPVQGVTSVVYTDWAGTAHTLSSALYGVDTAGVPGRIVLNYNESWPSDTLATLNPIRVRYVAGFGDAASDVPDVARRAIELLVAHGYENREPVLVGAGVLAAPIPFTVDSLVYLLRSEMPRGSV